jgi:hypothetical protein
VAIQLSGFPLGGRWSREGRGYHDVQHILDLDGKATLNEKVARGYWVVAAAVVVAVAVVAVRVLAHKLNGVGQR